VGGATGKAVGPRERHDGFTAAKKRACVEALATYGTIADACRVAGVSRKTFHYHRDKWPAFAAECEAALARAASAIEALAWERATIGAEEVIIRGGEVVQVKRKPSDSMLRMLLMASNPRRYGRLADARRKEIERQLRERIEAEVREEWRRRNFASNEQIEVELRKRLQAYGERVRAEAAALPEAGGEAGRGGGAEGEAAA
jgi:hypothetical protein